MSECTELYQKVCKNTYSDMKKYVRTHRIISKVCQNAHNHSTSMSDCLQWYQKYVGAHILIPKVCQDAQNDTKSMSERTY